MKRNPWLAAALSMLFPGAGQVYSGRSRLGAAFMLAFIIIGNLNAIWLSVFATSSTSTVTFFGYTFPRMLHDIFAFYSIVFWIWTAVDAYGLVKEGQNVIN